MEGTDDQHIVLSFSQDLEGRRWGLPFPLPVRREAAQWSPVLHADPRGRLWLFYAESVRRGPSPQTLNINAEIGAQWDVWRGLCF